MSNKREIRELLKQLSGGSQDLPVYECEVTAVNDDRTCDVQVIRTTLELPDVRLQGLPSYTTGVYAKPVIGTKCVLLLVGQVPYLIVPGESEEVELNGNNHGGLIIVSELVSNLSKLSARVDGIMDALTNAAVAPSPDAGATFKTNVVTALQALIDIEDFTEIENTKVKHGGS